MAAARTKKKDAFPKDDVDNSILAQLIGEQQQQSVEEQFSSDVSVVFCGMKRSGKTSIIDRFINPKKDEKDIPKPTVALDYKYARKEASENSTAKILAHIYDMGGEEGSENLVPIAVSPRTVGNLVACVTLDLSEPHGIIQALEKWVALIRGNVEKSLEGLSKESEGGAQRVAALKQARKEAYQDSPDAGAVDPLLCPTVIFGTKWDVLSSTAEPEKRKSVCKALRYFAHVNGASLVFVSLKEKEAMNATRALLRKLIFAAETKGGIPEQLDHGKPICVQAGKDSLEAIGKPHGASSSAAGWKQLLSTYFPDTGSGQGKEKSAQKLDEDLKKQEYGESSIDGMVAQRTMELDLYRRQVERNQRLASEGVALG